jgi:hypothetical protein
MSDPMAMDMSDGAGDVGGRGRSGGPLAVNRASSKIAKGLRRPVAQPRATAQIYKTEPSDFRSLVQQLTGTSSSSSSPSPSSSSSSSGEREPGPPPTKPTVSRLQKIAPPPLRPTFAYPTLHQQPQTGAAAVAPLPLATSAPGFSPLPFGRFSPLSSQRVSPFPVSPLSFSPLPVLSPSDNVWASSLSSLESPKAAGVLQQQQQPAENAVAGEGNHHHVRHESSSAAAADAAPLVHVPVPTRFPSPLSPKFAIPFGLPSPTGLGGFGMFGMSSTFSPTGAFTMDANFSFPEPEISMSDSTTP